MTNSFLKPPSIGVPTTTHFSNAQPLRNQANEMRDAMFANMKKVSEQFYEEKMKDDSLASLLNFDSDMRQYIDETADKSGEYNTDKFNKKIKEVSEKYSKQIGNDRYKQVYRRDIGAKTQRLHDMAMQRAKVRREAITRDNMVAYNKRVMEELEQMWKSDAPHINDDDIIIAQNEALKKIADSSLPKNEKQKMIADFKQHSFAGQLNAFIEKQDFEAATQYVEQYANSNNMKLSNQSLRTAYKLIEYKKKSYVAQQLDIFGNIEHALKTRSFSGKNGEESLQTAFENYELVKPLLNKDTKQNIQFVLWQAKKRLADLPPAEIQSQIDTLNADNSNHKNVRKIHWLQKELNHKQVSLAGQYKHLLTELTTGSLSETQRLDIVADMQRIAQESHNSELIAEAQEMQGYVYKTQTDGMSLPELTQSLDTLRSGTTALKQKNNINNAIQHIEKRIALFMRDPVQVAMNENIISDDAALNNEGFNMEVLQERMELMEWFTKDRKLPDQQGKTYFTQQEKQVIKNILSQVDTQEQRSQVVSLLNQLSSLPDNNALLHSLDNAGVIPQSLSHVAIARPDYIDEVVQGRNFRQEASKNGVYTKVLQGASGEKVIDYLTHYFDNAEHDTLKSSNMFAAITDYYAYLVMHDRPDDMEQFDEDKLNRAIKTIAEFKKDDVDADGAEGTLIYTANGMPDYDAEDLMDMNTEDLQKLSVNEGAIPVLGFIAGDGKKNMVAQLTPFSPDNTRAEYRFIATGDGAYRIQYFDEEKGVMSYVKQAYRDENGELALSNDVFEFSVDLKYWKKLRSIDPRLQHKDWLLELVP